jgi:hypothetical protein
LFYGSHWTYPNRRTPVVLRTSVFIDTYLHNLSTFLNFLFTCFYTENCVQWAKACKSSNKWDQSKYPDKSNISI